MEKLIQLQKELEPLIQEIYCYLDKQNFHFLNEGKVLPCLNKACLECIRKLITENKLLCGYCGYEHLIKNTDELTSIELQTHQTKLQEIKEKMNDLICGLLREFEIKDIDIENRCTKAKDEIKEKIKMQKNGLEQLHTNMTKKLEEIIENLVIELYKLTLKIEEKSSEFEILSKKIQESLDDFNEKELINEIYKCQFLIDEMKNLDDNFHQIIKQLFFEPSQWIPNNLFIYPFIKNFN